MRPGPFLAAMFLLGPCLQVSARGQARLPGPGDIEAGSSARLLDALEPAEKPSAAGFLLDDALGQRKEARGSRSHWLAGAGIGLVVGAGVTYLLLSSGGSNSLCDRSENQDALNEGECLGLTALGGLAGAGVGALIGGRIRTEREPEPRFERMTIVGLTPQGGIRVGLAMSF